MRHPLSPSVTGKLVTFYVGGDMRTLVAQISEYVTLHRDQRTGIAWVEDGTTGQSHSAHPSIDASGSIRGMKKLGYWGKADRTVRCRGFIYNVDRCVVTDYFDRIACNNCRCGGKHVCESEQEGSS